MTIQEQKKKLEDLQRKLAGVRAKLRPEAGTTDAEKEVAKQFQIKLLNEIAELQGKKVQWERLFEPETSPGQERKDDKIGDWNRRVDAEKMKRKFAEAFAEEMQKRNEELKEEIGYKTIEQELKKSRSFIGGVNPSEMALIQIGLDIYRLTDLTVEVIEKLITEYAQEKREVEVQLNKWDLTQESREALLYRRTSIKLVIEALKLQRERRQAYAKYKFTKVAPKKEGEAK